jgi:hypothetical protein
MLNIDSQNELFIISSIATEPINEYSTADHISYMYSMGNIQLHVDIVDDGNQHNN